MRIAARVAIYREWALATLETIRDFSWDMTYQKLARRDAMAKRVTEFFRYWGALAAVSVAVIVMQTIAEPQRMAAVPQTKAISTAPDTILPPGYSTTVTGGMHDFDYFVGAWTTRQRALKERGAGNKEWQEFPSTICVTPYLDGMVVVSEMYSPTRGSAGFTVRAFDLKKQQWSVHFISSKAGQMDPGVFGGFQGAHGEFYGEDVDNGRPIKAQNTWTKVDHEHARWEQAFSYDNRTWETNWIAEFTRADPSTTCESGHPKR